MKSRKALRLQLVALGKQLEESIAILNTIDRNHRYGEFDRQQSAIATMGRAIEAFAKACAPALERPALPMREVDIASTQIERDQEIADSEAHTRSIKLRLGFHSEP